MRRYKNKQKRLVELNVKEKSNKTNKRKQGSIFRFFNDLRKLNKTMQFKENSIIKRIKASRIHHVCCSPILVFDFQE